MIILKDMVPLVDLTHVSNDLTRVLNNLTRVSNDLTCVSNDLTRVSNDLTRDILIDTRVKYTFLTQIYHHSTSLDTCKH